MKALSDSLECDFTVNSFFPEWAYKHESKTRELFKRVYLEKYGKELEIEVAHAGLECGFFMEKIPYLDAVSYGPNMFNVILS
jgi:dipeptidase D